MGGGTGLVSGTGAAVSFWTGCAQPGQPGLILPGSPQTGHGPGVMVAARGRDTPTTVQSPADAFRVAVTELGSRRTDVFLVLQLSSSPWPSIPAV